MVFRFYLEIAGSSKNVQSQHQNTGLTALQNMALLGNNSLGSSSQSSASNPLAGLTSKDSLSALFLPQSQAEAQAFIKQHQKLLQQLPANSIQRKTYEALLNDMKQAAEYTAKLSASSSQDSKVNKWLSEQPLADQQHLSSSEYRRSTRQQQQQQAQHQHQQQGSATERSLNAMLSPSQSAANAKKAVTGDETVPVVNRLTGKRLTGSKAPTMKRLHQWLTENPTYEIDSKWMEYMRNPTPPSPKQSVVESLASNLSAKQSQRSLSNASNQQSTSATNYANQSLTSSSSKKSRNSNAMDATTAAQMQQFAGLAGLNPNLLSSLPLGFDAKNPLLMPFGGLPGLSAMGSLGNLNNMNMNMFANLAAIPGLAGLDAQSLAAVVAAAGTNIGGLTGKGTSSSSQSTSAKERKSSNASSSQQQQHQQSSSSNQQSSKSAATSMANNFPFMFPNPLYTPLGLGGLHPYSHGSSMNVYEQLAQQYNLLNGALSSGANTSTTQSASTASSSRQQSSSKLSSSRSSSMNTSNTQSPSSRGRGGNSSSSTTQYNRETAHLQSMLTPQDPHLLETLSRATGIDISTLASMGAGATGGGGSSGGGGRSSSKSQQQQHSAKESTVDKAEKERRKLLESLTRSGLPPDIAAMQAYASGKMPGSSSSSSSASKAYKDAALGLGMPPEISQALFAEMAAQAAAAVAATSSSSSSSKKREQDMKDAMDQLNKSQMEMFARNLGMGSGISLIPTSSASSAYASLLEEPKSKRSRMSSSALEASLSAKDDFAHLMAAAAAAQSGDDKHLRTMSRSRGSGASERSSSASTNETTIEKVTLSPVAAASIAGLPPQTSITIAPSSLASQMPSSLSATAMTSALSSAENLPSNHSQMLSPKQQNQSMPQQSPQHERPPSRQHSRDREPKQSAQHHQESMDLEDLIAPSKVSKASGSSTQSTSTVSMAPSHSRDRSHEDARSEGTVELDCSKTSNEHDSDSRSKANDSGSNEQLDSDGMERRGRRTRGKRPRSGEDFESLVLPERKRELRSSAGRLAAAAAARHALEAKMASASSHESLNLSTTSSASDDHKNHDD